MHVVSALWNAGADIESPALAPPNEPALHGSGAVSARRAIVAGVIFSLLTAGAIIAATGSTSRVPEFEARAATVAQDALGGLGALEEAVNRVAAPDTSLSELSDGAAVIADLDTASRELLAIGRTPISDLTGGWRGLASSPPQVPFTAFATAGEAASTLEDELSALLTTRLILGSVLALPQLPIQPDTVGVTGEQIAAAIATSRSRIEDLPPDHAEIGVDAADTIARVEGASAEYLAAVRNGETAERQLDVILAELAALDERAAAHVSDAAADLRVKFDAYVEALAVLR